MLYGTSLVLIGLVLSTLWWYAVTRGLTAGLNQMFVSYVHRRNLTPAAVYLTAVVMAFVDTRISIALYALVPVLYMLPVKHIDAHIDGGGA